MSLRRNSLGQRFWANYKDVRNSMMAYEKSFEKPGLG